MWRRLWALTQKELIQLIRDRRTLIMVMVGSALEVFLFAAAVHTDIKNIGMVVADQSRSTASRQYLSSFETSGTFNLVSDVSGKQEVVDAIDSGQASIGLIIPPDFSNRLEQGRATVLMLLNGSSSYTTQSAYNAAKSISQQYAVSLIGQTSRSPLTAHIQILYNPDLIDLWFILPALMVFMLQALSMNFTSLGVDPVSRREFWNLLGNLRTDKGLTIFMTTPYMDEAERCTQVGLITSGGMIASGSPAQIKAMLPGHLLEFTPSAFKVARQICAALPGVLETQAYGEKLHVFVDDVMRLKPQIESVLAAEGIQHNGLREIEVRMEEAYISLIQRHLTASEREV
jgi:hypothetical protein